MGSDPVRSSLARSLSALLRGFVGGFLQIGCTLVAALGPAGASAQPVDTTGALPPGTLVPLADAGDRGLIDWLAQGRAMPMGLTLGADGNPIWADYARGDIRSLDDQDREFPLALRAGGRPVAVGSTGQGALVWTTDGEFPRRVRMADPDSGLPRDLIAGEDVNRPSAVAIDARSHVLYWAEHTNGRILRAKLDGADPEEIVNERQLVSFGLGLDLEDRRLLWSDYLGGRILAVSVDGADPEVLC